MPSEFVLKITFQFRMFETDTLNNYVDYSFDA